MAILALALPVFAFNLNIKVPQANLSHHGGYGSLDFRMSEFNGQEVFMAGVTGGFTLNRRTLIGVAAYGFAPEMAVVSSSGSESSYIMGGYGGMLFEYTLFRKRMINFSLSWLGGVGAFVVSPDSVWGGFNPSYISSSFSYDYSGPEYVSLFLVSEPGLSINLNLTRWFKVCAQVSYRSTLGGDVAGLSDKELSGMNAGLQFKFGAF